MSQARFVVFGDINLDVIARIPSYPEPGGDGLAPRGVIRPGGSAANVAAGLGQLGADVRLIARVGRDPLGNMALAALAESGVDISGVQVDAEEMTGVMFIPVMPDGERTMFGVRGANARTQPSEVDAGSFAGLGVLHLSGYALLSSPQREAAARAVVLARAAGGALSLDPGLETISRCPDAVRGLLPGLDMLFGTGAELCRLAGDTKPEGAVRRLMASGAAGVAAKLGQGGCLVASAASFVRLPAFEVDVVDSTGAGDAFDAAFLYGRLGGLSLVGAGILANAAGAIVAMREGAMPAGRAEVAGLLTMQRERPEWREYEQEVAQALDLL